jgi:hypothetical protein
MMKPVYLGIITVILSATFIMANDSTKVIDSAAAVPVDTLKTPPPDSAYIARAADSRWWKRKIENQAFGVGEYLKFAVSYAGIPAGSAVMEVPEIIEYDGTKCYKLMSTARSNGFVSTFYRVDDTVISYIDYDGIFTRYFRKHLREGGYKTDKETIFDQRRHLAITGRDTVPTYAFVQDAFSSLYYVRTQAIEPGVDLFIDNHTDKKNYPLKIIVYGREEVEVPAGKFDCLVVEPVMRAEGIFKAKGRIKIWLTDDQYKIPVKMQTEVFFLGSIAAKLVEFRHGISPADSVKVIGESVDEKS